MAKKQNPFVKLFLENRPLVGASSARLSEEAWDKAIQEASRIANDRGDYETRDKIFGLLSSQQRDVKVSRGNRDAVSRSYDRFKRKAGAQ